MKIPNFPCSRRTLLKGCGASLALPVLESITLAAPRAREQSNSPQPKLDQSYPARDGKPYTAKILSVRGREVEFTVSHAGGVRFDSIAGFTEMFDLGNPVGV